MAGMATQLTRIFECCVVPYRVTGAGAEFCLITPNSENRWAFPKIPLSDESEADEKVRRQAAEMAGLSGLIDDKLLGAFVATRHSETRSMVGFLMRVDEIADKWPHQNSHRRIWCLPEEARMRIRRKPLRRFIDLAIHDLRQSQPQLPR
jgi:ADP-ribose pyrophosphatase YjhB (NUDIX family)